MTPTNASLGELDPAGLSKLDAEGRHVAGGKPTKEAFLHRVMYAKRPSCEAVVHLHSTHSVAVSCLHGIDAHDCLPPITAYYVMRVGRLPLVPYHPPGDETLARAVERLAGEHHAVLLANHGPVVSGTSLDNAMYATEELEETAKLFLAAARLGHQAAHGRAGGGAAAAVRGSLRTADILTCETHRQESRLDACRLPPPVRRDAGVRVVHE